MHALQERVPGDVSAAAFWLVAGAIHPDAELTLHHVGVNPTRRAVIDTLRAMGADIEERPVAGAVQAGAEQTARFEARSDDGVGEPIATIVVRSSALHAIDLGPRDVAAAIDEIPVLCLAACLAEGTTVIRGAGVSATRSRTGSPGSSPASARSVRGSMSTATTSPSTAAPRFAARSPTASTTTAWR